jgi:hypothetical protein
MTPIGLALLAVFIGCLPASIVAINAWRSGGARALREQRRVVIGLALLGVLFAVLVIGPSVGPVSPAVVVALSFFSGGLAIVAFRQRSLTDGPRRAVWLLGLAALFGLLGLVELAAKY